MQLARALMVTVGLFTMAACGSGSLADDCKKACDSPCPGTTVSDVTACKADCDATQKILDRTGCADEAKAVSDCSGGTSCTQSNADCSSQASKYLACYLAYCQAHPDDTAACSAN
jgi:hypothetical protein